MEFEVESERAEVHTNLNMHFKNNSGTFDSIKRMRPGERDMREGGEFIYGYKSDATSHCNIQGDDSDDSDGAHSLHSGWGLKVAARPSEDNTPVKMESFQRLSTNEIIAARIRRELEARH